MENNAEKYEEVKQRIVDEGGHYHNGVFSVNGKNGTKWLFTVDEKKLLDDCEKYHTVVSEVMCLNQANLPVQEVPAIESCDAISGAPLGLGQDLPGNLVPAVGKAQKMEKFEAFIDALMEDDVAWIDLYMANQEADYWNEGGFEAYRTLQSLHEEWRLFEELNERCADVFQQAGTLVPFLTHHSKLETDDCLDAWQSLFQFLSGEGIKVEGNEVSIDVREFTFRFELELMQDAEGCGLAFLGFHKGGLNPMPADFHEHGLSYLWFEMGAPISYAQWESCVIEMMHARLSNQFAVSECDLDSILAKFKMFDADFLERLVAETTIDICVRFWQEKEWPDPHIEDSYTMADYRREKAAYRKQVEEDYKTGPWELWGH